MLIWNMFIIIWDVFLFIILLAIVAIVVLLGWFAYYYAKYQCI